MDRKLRIWDITPPITEDLAVFPGDVAFSRNVAMDFPQDHLALSSVTTTLHIGAHADSSSHYHAEGVGVDQRPLERYLGNCQVVDVLALPRNARILPEHVQCRIEAKRVLFKTGSFPNPNRWNSDFNSLSPELVDFLAGQGVTLVGIDTPSVDPAESKGLESHQALFRRDVAVLEGLILDRVPAGIYTLIALPLPLKDADASPVRAILLDKDQLGA
jgi:arylformamidase